MGGLSAARDFPQGTRRRTGLLPPWRHAENLRQMSPLQTRAASNGSHSPKTLPTVQRVEGLCPREPARTCIPLSLPCDVSVDAAVRHDGGLFVRTAWTNVVRTMGRRMMRLGFFRSGLCLRFKQCPALSERFVQSPAGVGQCDSVVAQHSPLVDTGPTADLNTSFH